MTKLRQDFTIIARFSKIGKLVFLFKQNTFLASDMGLCATSPHTKPR